MLPVRQVHNVHDAVTRCEAPPQSLSFMFGWALPLKRTTSDGKLGEGLGMKLCTSHK